MPGHAPADWATEAALRQLRAWWTDTSDTSISSGEMARRLGTTKNAIVGKAHRMALEPRLSPISRTPRLPGDPPRKHRKHEDVQPAPVSRDVPKLAPLASLGPLAAATPLSWPQVVERIAARPVCIVRTARPADDAPVKPIPAPFVARPRTEPCCWITAMGAKGKLPIYCDDESTPGKPFCPRHCGLAYVKIRDRSEDAAHAMGGD